MATINPGPAKLDIVNLVVGRPHTLTLTLTDSAGDPFTPSAVTMRAWNAAGALLATIAATVNTGTAELALDAITAAVTDQARLRHEIVADGASWIKGQVEVRPQSDAHGLGSSSSSATVTVSDGASGITVASTVGYIGDFDGGNAFAVYTSTLTIDGGGA